MTFKFPYTQNKIFSNTVPIFSINDKPISSRLTKKILGVFALFFLASNAIQAYDFGYVSVTGFVLAEADYTTNICKDCQRYPDDNRQRGRADDIKPGKKYEPAIRIFTLFHPYLNLNPLNLGKGFELSAMVSQRWRDGKVELPGFVYDLNATLSQESYGSITYGAFATRGWRVADYSYGSKVGLADAWGSSGSGYELLTNAIRITGPLFDVSNGDLQLEFTYDPGSPDFGPYKKSFMEYYLQYAQGRYVLDFVFQDTKNGKPGSWTHAPFAGLTDDSKYKETLDGRKLPENAQTMYLLMMRYQINVDLEVLGGYRRNYWSGVDAVIVGKDGDGDDLYNEMFNVDWDKEKKPGYSAISYDMMLGATYKYSSDISFSTGYLKLGTAKTDNPSERGQSNSFRIINAGVGYSGLYPNLVMSMSVARAEHAKKGLASLSMPHHSSYGGVDSRVAKNSSSIGIEALYTF